MIPIPSETRLAKSLLTSYKQTFAYSGFPRACFILESPSRTVVEFYKEELEIHRVSNINRFGLFEDGEFESGVRMGFDEENNTAIVINDSPIYKSGAIMERLLKVFKSDNYMLFEQGVLPVSNHIQILRDIQFKHGWGLVGMRTQSMTKKFYNNLDMKFRNFMVYTEMQKRNKFGWDFYTDVGLLEDYGVVYIKGSFAAEHPFMFSNVDKGFLRDYVMKSSNEGKGLYLVKDFKAFRIEV